MGTNNHNANSGCSCISCRNKFNPERTRNQKIAAVRRALIRAGFNATKVRLGNTFTQIWHGPGAKLDLEYEVEPDSTRRVRRGVSRSNNTTESAP